MSDSVNHSLHEPRESSAPRQIQPSHLARLAVVYVRQSSAEQVRDYTGSTAAQRAQGDFARRWGWPDSHIVINDQDLGLSGTSISNRKGFIELLGMVSRGEVGMVLVQAIDRLNRKTGDFINLLEIAAEANTLICIDGHVHDPASEDLSEMLSLQVQGMFGAFDNRL